MVETASYRPGPEVRGKFKREIEQLLADVPAEQWADPEIRGVFYDFIPWHRSSSVTLQTRDDIPGDFAAWKYYFSAESDGSRLREEFEAWQHEPESNRLVYHRLLIEAAEAFLSIDFSKYGNPFWSPIAIDRDFCLNKTFLLQIFDADGTFTFNYCDYVLARRLEVQA